MERRELLVKGACLVCAAAVPAGRLLAQAGAAATPAAAGPIAQRTFRLELRPFVTRLVGRTAFWLRALLERLGRDETLALWHAAHAEADDALLREALRGPWEPTALADSGTGASSAFDWQLPSWNSPVGGVSGEHAVRLVRQAFPFPAIEARFGSFEQARQIGAYHALHLLHHGTARLAEGLVDRLGKQGELIAYDVIRAFREQQAAAQKSGVEEFLRSFAEIPKESNLFTAGTTLRVLRSSSTEVLAEVTECEWARYFRTNHPRVGYLVACSTDEAAYRTANPALRLQRTTTIMEGGRACDFRVYSVA